MALNLEAVGKKIGPLVKDYTWKDVVLYALGVGAGFDELEYCYEEKLKVIPSFAIAAVFEFLASAALNSESNLAGILHGEQDMIFHNPIPTEGRLTTEGKITHIYDKGPSRGALVVAEADTVHSNGARLFTNIFTVFSRLDGGFGGKDAPKETFEFPGRSPDFEQTDSPSSGQPLLYRLSGDIFALHVDPEFAKASGFERPIMHGLCTHGFACRAVIKHLFPGQPERMRRFKVRFSKTLYPGIAVKTQVWKLGEGRAVFRTLNAQNGEVVIDRGIVEWEAGGEARKSTSPLPAGPKPVRFDGRVAVVTGAGGGLGRVYALELAKRGAKVVVNDLGGARDGSGTGSSRPADQVVAEIQGLGGEAVASYDSVSTEEGGKALVEKAVTAFGRLDIVINNAGILRDKTILKMEKGDWEAVMGVHLDGAYHVTRPAVQRMKEQGYGRIVMSTSAAGLFGNFGQTNYSAAKMGLVGLMNTLKLEGAKYDIKVNAVAPVAATRLTQDVLPPEIFEKMKPEFVAPLVLYLVSEGCQASGLIVNAGMGCYCRSGIVAGKGELLGDGKSVPTIEDVRAHWAAVNDLAGAEPMADTNAFFGTLLERFQPKSSDGPVLAPRGSAK